MIRRAFQPAISILIFLGLFTQLLADTSIVAPHGDAKAIASQKFNQHTKQHLTSCHDSYSAPSFEIANNDLQEFIDEYFYDAKIPFFPNEKELRELGLIQKEQGVYQKPNALTTAGGNRHYPTASGLWKAVKIDKEVWEYHLLIREPQNMAQMQAFNTNNDLLGEPFADYDDQAYGMTLKPEDIRQKWNQRYFTINVHIYGLRDDATKLSYTVSDIIFTDYTNWVKQNSQCKTEGKQL